MDSSSVNPVTYGVPYSNSTIDMLLNSPLWESFSNRLRPRNMVEALYWSNWLKTTYGDYISAIQRAVAYHLNGIDLTGDEIDIESRNRYEAELLNKHNLLTTMLELGIDLQCNGNVFMSAIMPVNRTLICPHCGNLRYLTALNRGKDYDFHPTTMTFESTCPSCKKRGDQKIKDFQDKSGKPLNIISWNPLNIDMDYCSLTDAKKIKWVPERMDKEFISNLAQSAALETIPLPILEAMSHDEAVMFKPASILHLSLSTDAMNRSYMRGWGLPGWMPGFKYIVLLMLLERQLESAAKDFVLPLRLLFPKPDSRGGSGPAMGTDAYNGIPLGMIRGQVENALKTQSLRQSSWHLLSQPVDSMQLGGDAKAIIPVEILEYVKTGLLESQSVPVEFGKPSLQIGASGPPPSFRLFESTWARTSSQHDIAFNWYLGRCSELLGWPRMEGSLIKPSLVFDPATMQIMAGGNANGKISDTSFYRRIGIDPRLERKMLLEEAVEKMKFDKELQKRQQDMGFFGDVLGISQNAAMSAGAQVMQQNDPNAQSQPGQPAAPGAPQSGPVVGPNAGGDPSQVIGSMMSMTPGTAPSPDQLQADAQQAAQMIVTIPPGAQRNRLYSMIKSANPTMHALVKQMTDTLEQDAARQGIEAARGQQQ